VFLAGLVLLAAAAAASAADFPPILKMRERKAAVDRVTKLRLETLLPRVMRESGFDMWLLICNEDAYDPVFLTMVPEDAWCPITQILVFFDPGPGKPIERLNVSRTNMEGLHAASWTAPPTGEDEGKSQWEALTKIVREKNPKKIGINQSDVIWAADGLSASLKDRLVRTLGPDLSSRLRPAEAMSVRWLETLLDEDVALMEKSAAVSHAIIAETFSNKVIVPDATTADDLVFHYRQRTADFGLDKAFRPFFRVVGRHPDVLKAHPLPDDIIRRGDVLHCDVGVKYLRYNSDQQEMAYVLRTGETDVPAGLKAGLAEGNKLQDVFCGEFKAGLTGNELLGRILAKAKASGIAKPRIYSHSLGYYLHEPGPLIGLPWAQDTTGLRGEIKLVPNSAFTVELSVERPVPEWGGQDFRFRLEQDVVFTGKAMIFLDGRQTRYHVVR
jgi:Xaa-Pro aminopeptidase